MLPPILSHDFRPGAKPAKLAPQAAPGGGVAPVPREAPRAARCARNAKPCAAAKHRKRPSAQKPAQPAQCAVATVCRPQAVERHQQAGDRGTEEVLDRRQDRGLEDVENGPAQGFRTAQERIKDPFGGLLEVPVIPSFTMASSCWRIMRTLRSLAWAVACSATPSVL